MSDASHPPAESDTADWSARLGGVVHRVRRAELLASGDLLDVSVSAYLAGFRVPVAVSRAVWIDCVECFKEDTEASREHAEAFQLAILLLTAASAARRKHHAEALLFSLAQGRPRGKALKRTTLKLICSLGDDREPVNTVLHRCED